MQANAENIQKLRFRKFIIFYRQIGYKSEHLGYNMTKFGKKVQNEIIEN